MATQNSINITDLTITTFAKTLLDDADQASMQGTLSLVPGTDVQVYDPALLSIAGLSINTDEMIYGTGVDTYATTSLTAFARTLLDDTTANAMRATLGLGSMSTQTSGNVLISGGTIGGITDLLVGDGGTGRSSALAYSVICGGTTATSVHQSVVSVGNAGEALTSNGVGALPTWQAISATSAIDNIFVIKDNADNTKEIAFQASAITTGTTRTITMSDQDINLTPNTGTYQASDAGLTSISGLTTIADTMIYTTASDTYTTATLTAYGRTLVSSAAASNARTALELDTMAQQSSSSVSITGGTISLTSPLGVPSGGTGISSVTAFGVICGGTSSTNPLQSISPGSTGQILFSNGGVAAPSFGNTEFPDNTFLIKDNADATKFLAFQLSGLTTATTRTITAADQDINMTPTTGSYQGSDAGLTSIAGLTTAADNMIYTTALDTYAVTTLTAYARTLLDDVDAATARTTLGLGTMATQAASNVAITGGTITTLTSPIAVDSGGTGVNSVTAYELVIGGTTSTNPLQTVTAAASSAQILFGNATLAPQFANPSFNDSVFSIHGSSDASKRILFEVDGLTTATDRTVTAADQNINMTPNTGSYCAAAGGTQLVTTGALNSGTIASGFGNINNGTSNLSTGVITATSIGFGDEALANYDEGTFTPEITCTSPGTLSITYSAQVGTYTRIGDICFVEVNVRTSSVTLGTASGNIRIAGLPFNTNGSRCTFALNLDNYNWTNSASWLVGRTRGNNPEIQLLEMSDAASDAFVPIDVLNAANTQIVFSGTFFIL